MSSPMVFTSYSGSDCTIQVNNSVIPEVQEFKFVESFTTDYPRIYGEIICAVFGTEPSLRKAIRIQDGESIMRVRYMNEYGQSNTVDFIGITFIERSGGISIDDICTIETYKFEATDFGYHDGLPDWPLQDDKEVTTNE